jgi:hypothetical protein
MSRRALRANLIIQLFIVGRAEKDYAHRGE